jgi:FkbM family methyltransferase
MQPFIIETNYSKNQHLGYDNCNMQTNGEKKLIHQLIKAKMIIFDVGANVGEWTKSILEHHSSVNIYAFEPIKNSFDSLSRKLKQYEHVSCFNIAFDKECLNKEMYVYSGLEEAQLSSFYHRPILDTNLQQEPKKIYVKTINLDRFCQEQNINYIDYLKIDTEGAELDVLKGAQHMLASEKIAYIQFEYGGTYRDAHITLEQIYNLLHSNNYHVFRITPFGLIYLNEWQNNFENYRYSNYLAVNQYKLKELYEN